MAKKVPFRQLDPKDVVRLPGPLFTLIQQYQAERDWFRKVHRLIDTIEWAMKWHTVLTVSDMLREASLSPEMKVLLSSGLRTPSLGIWFLFFCESLAALKHPMVPWNHWQRLEALEKKHQIIGFRNRYAHGATPEDEVCEKDCAIFEPVLMQIIGSELFTELRLAVSNKKETFLLKGDLIDKIDLPLDPGKTWALLPDGRVLELWPLGVYAPDPEQPPHWNFYYFNALKGKKIEQLNYELARLLRDRDLWEPFHRTLPLHDWRRLDEPELDLFRTRIESLTEGFKGRFEERKRVKDFCLGGKGSLIIWGAPGIGKSALIAQVFTEMKAGMTSEGELADVKYPAMIEYFIRRGTGTDSQDQFLRHVNQKLDVIYDLKGIALGNSTTELWENMVKRLNVIEERENQEPLVLFVDGLDECPDIRRYIPESSSFLKVVISSRPNHQILKWSRTWERERKEEMEIVPMAECEVRAMLYDVVDKYQDGFNEIYVNEVTLRSQGNPLYLKLLCDQIFSHGGRVGSVEDIPEDIQDLYRDTIDRISEAKKHHKVLQVLYLLTVAKSGLTVQAIAEFLEIPTAMADKALDRCRELLYEDQENFQHEEFQLFHESLREWLWNRHRKDTRAMAKRLADLSFNYKTRIDKDARQYALRHAADHLADHRDHERLWTLMRDEEYRKEQIQTFNQYNPAFNAFKNAIEFYVKREGKTPQDDPRLCWLALRAGELGHQARTDIHEAFEWVRQDPKRIGEALERLEVLGENNFFKAALLLLWIDAERQGELPEDEREYEYAEKVFKAVDQKIPLGSGTVDWGEFLSSEFMGWWTASMLTNLGGGISNQLFAFVGRCDDWSLEPLIKTCVRTGISWGKGSGFKSFPGVFHFAITAVKRIRNDNYKSEALSAIATALAQAGELKQAKHFFQQAIATAEHSRYLRYEVV